MKYFGIKTQWNGINFRSRLEVSWAKFFSYKKSDWSYVDAAWYDFGVDMHRVEIKPFGREFLDQALLRAIENEWQGELIVLQGPPEAGCTIHVCRNDGWDAQNPGVDRVLIQTRLFAWPRLLTFSQAVERICVQNEWMLWKQGELYRCLPSSRG